MHPAPFLVSLHINTKNTKMKIISLVRRISHFFNLQPELEKHDVIHDEILKGVSFKGTNLWILVFAIIVASVGLNMNSTAVIIGAMLISPLMGPINGMGYSIATYDGELFYTSLRNFLFAVGASLVASTIYFAISPISTAHSELLARTSPTIYDVLIALFGGFAGIVAISSRLKGNVIPGVAIATALMPPLCTAGYGLATGQATFFFGAFYLFLINTIFIALASAWITKLLKIPIRGVVNPVKKRNINRVISTITTLILLPSIYFGYKLVQEERFTQNATKYISNITVFEGNYLLKSNINPDKKEITLLYGGNSLSESQKESISEKSKIFGIEGKIHIEQGFSINEMSGANKEVQKLQDQILKLSAELNNKQSIIDTLSSHQTLGLTLLSEINALFPQIQSCSFADSKLYKMDSNQPKKSCIVVLGTKEEISVLEKTKIMKWLEKRIQCKDIELVIKSEK